MISKTLPGENRLLFELSQGSEPAFNEIYKFYSQRLYGKLLKSLKSELYAEEILQEVFIVIWEQRHTIDPGKSFRSYLFRIAENKVCDFFRKSGSESFLRQQLGKCAIEEYSYIQESLEATENVAILNCAIDSLPPQCRTIFRLCKLEGKSYKEVSEKMGISIFTISNHIVKATSCIREYLSCRYVAQY